MLTQSEATALHATHTPTLRAENEVPYFSNADLLDSVYGMGGSQAALRQGRP
ncbi:hypothetical protein [Paraburkholderia youngii]|uniref:hypothetical protein n=1 Tax=Paraburkholderia youngii TaxID=2782701 RepID=UPI003D20E872